MERSLELMGNAISSFFSSLWNALQPLGQSLGPTVQRLDPLTWGIIAVSLLILLLLVTLLRRRPEEPTLSKPELLVSLGEIRVLEDHVESEQGGRTGLMRPVSHALRMTVSNLNTYPVQLLEVALKTSEMDAPITLEAAQIIAPESSVMLKETLPTLRGEEGKLTLYFYLSGGSKRYVSLQANFAFEPWDARYKVSPLGQTLTPFRQLASANVSKARERSWQEEQERTAQRERREKVAAYSGRGERYVERPRDRRKDSQEVESQHDERPSGGFNFPDEF